LQDPAPARAAAAPAPPAAAGLQPSSGAPGRQEPPRAPAVQVGPETPGRQVPPGATAPQERSTAPGPPPAPGASLAPGNPAATPQTGGVLPSRAHRDQASAGGGNGKENSASEDDSSTGDRGEADDRGEAGDGDQQSRDDDKRGRTGDGEDSGAATEEKNKEESEKESQAENKEDQNGNIEEGNKEDGYEEDENADENGEDGEDENGEEDGEDGEEVGDESEQIGDESEEESEGENREKYRDEYNEEYREENREESKEDNAAGDNGAGGEPAEKSLSRAVPARSEPAAGTLYLVGTPIGNLEDLSPRARRILESVERIACEDTRHSGLLLSRLGIRGRPLISFHSHNEAARIPQLLDALAAGQAIALISDAGLPGISDPGETLVAAARRAGRPVVCIPGPTALTTALVSSGLPTGRFCFEGFLPPRGGARRQRLEALAEEPRTLIFYEAPHRLLALLEDLLAVLGDRPIQVARELTKRHEQQVGPSVAQALEHFRRTPPQGECTVVLGGATAPEPPAWDGEALREALAALVASGLSRREAARSLAERSGHSRRALYALLHQPPTPEAAAEGAGTGGRVAADTAE